MNALATVVRMGVLLVFLAPLVVTGFTVYPAIVGKSLYIRTLIEIVAALWLILIIYRPEYRLRLGPVTVALAGLVFITILATIFSVDPTRSLWSTYSRSQGVFELLHWVALAVIAGAMFRDRVLLDRIPAVAVIVGVVVGILGLLLMLYENQVPNALLSVDHQGQVVSTIGQHTFVGAYLVFTTCCALILLAKRQLWPMNSQPVRQRLWTLFLLASLPFFGYVSWLTTSRFGFLTLVAVIALQLLITGAFTSNHRARLVAFGSLSTVLVALVIVVATVVVMNDLSKPRVSQGANPVIRLANLPNDRTASPRIHMIDVAWKSMLDRPLGYGPENFHIAWGRYIGGESFNWQVGDQAHNKVAEAMATTGVLGLLAWLTLVGTLGYTLIRNIVHSRRATTDGPAYPSALLLTLFGYLVVAMFVFDTQVLMLHFCFVLILGTALEPKFAVRLPFRIPVPRILTYDFVHTMVAVLIVSVLVWSTVQVNGRYGLAATAAGGYTILTAHQGPFGESLYLLTTTMNIFPAMADSMLLEAVPQVSDRLTDTSVRNAAAAERVMTPLVAGMVDDHPGDWRVHMTAALWYHNLTVSQGYPYRDEADHHLTELQRLSPTNWHTKKMTEKWGW